MRLDRDLSSRLTQPALPIRVLVGPRQSGKSTLLAHLFTDAAWVSLDDLQVRDRAQTDPAFLLDSVGSGADRPLILDEAAYAPNLFPEVKRRVDQARLLGKPEPTIYMTGSNRLLLDTRVRESLAGRASYFFLHSLSVSELSEHATLRDWMFRGGWPELYVRRELNPSHYLADYVRTFVEKDIAESAGVERLIEFHRVLTLLAARTGTLLNATDIGQLAGVKGQTVSGWIELLERNALVLRLQPYHSNLNKRVTRTPKVYILDTGLAAHLQGWRAVEPLLASPQAGPLFETLVLGELVRARDHADLPLDLHFWRTKDGEEIDFLIRVQGQTAPSWLALDAKLAIHGAHPLAVPKALANELPELRETWVITAGGEPSRLSPTCRRVPIANLHAALLETAQH